jgi:hypothetical protein
MWSYASDRGYPAGIPIKSKLPAYKPGVFPLVLPCSPYWTILELIVTCLRTKTTIECQQGEFKCLGISDEVYAKLRLAIDPIFIQEDEELVRRKDIEQTFLKRKIRHMLIKFPELKHEQLTQFFLKIDTKNKIN